MSKLVVSGGVAVECAPGLALQPWQEPDWQRLWLATHSREREWRSLALLPGSAGMPTRFMEKVAVGLSRTGMTHLGHAIHVADATRVRLEELSGFLEEVAHCTASGDRRVVIALAALDENVTSLSIAQHVDRALLCVLRGHTELSALRRTVRDVGKTRFLGSVMFDGLD
jgi:hypothetical protein